jgi:hypothetical protein
MILLSETLGFDGRYDRSPSPRRLALCRHHAAYLDHEILRQLQDGKKYPIGANGAAVYDYAGHCLMVNGLHYSDFLSFYEEHKNILPYGGSLYCYTLDEVAYFEDSYFIMMEREAQRDEGDRSS